ncbi:hypothetical protein AV545_03875 [Paenibacillus jamilae]|uniref:hypothetical protein n=1 Tax=Paenibacillus jamilae TaxID=114136 RepID=UPI0007ABCA96|nr:hypothetical protein [Paenibacillus jamilae]KZE65070.1 hypothetical protein AV545_03875 [Paenibacillus jamilae]
MTIYEDMDRLRREVEEKAALLKAMESKHFDVNGIWKISTEGDCEGRSIKQLGTYEGNLFDGIRLYNRSSYYSLTCERVGYLSLLTNKKPAKKKVHFQVRDETMRKGDDQEIIKQLLPSVPDGCALSTSNYYGCIALEWEE